MSNNLSIRRVKVQTLDDFGNPEGDPTYGIMASDSYEQAYIDIYSSFAELEQAINEAGSILAAVASGDQFSDLNHESFGAGNFFGCIFPDDSGLFEPGGDHD